MAKIQAGLHKMLNGSISPMVYVMTSISIITGAAYSFLPFLPDIQRSILFNYGVAMGINVWGMLLLVGSIVVLIGCIYKHDKMIKIGSMVSFMMWLFATATYFTNAFYFVVVTYGLFHILFYVYLYLATSLGYIRRRSSQ